MKSNTAVEAAGFAESDEDAPDSPIFAEACAPAGIQPIVRIREEHNISRRDIDPDALKVLYRLARNNYIAYLVGGGVRDLLLGRKPKDFDISTNARPEQIRSLFRNCILIGRRFRLAHVRYGEKIIETSTFRTTPKQEGDPADPAADLFQRDDNLFGSPHEDALRRDFTVNGLFYDIESFSIIDYVGGMEDLAARRIRCIGDPCIRFREDPVRMVRAIRFASRLDFTLEPDTEEAIRRHGEELVKASPARLLEEITRLFAFSSGEKAVRLLHSTGLLRVILPEVADCLESDKVDHQMFWRRLRALDQGDTVHPDVTPPLIFAVLLLDALKLNMGRDWTFADAPRLKFDKVHAFLDPLALRLKFPRKLTDRLVHIYLNQHRFAHPGTRGKRGSIANFVTQEAFHESLALAEIVLTVEGGSQSALNQWRELLAERIYGREEGPGSQHPNGHERRERRGHAAAGASAAAAPAAIAAGAEPVRETAGEAEGEIPAGKRLSRSARRRRNKRMRRHESAHGGGGAAAEVVETPAAETSETAESVSTPGENRSEPAAEPRKPAAKSRNRRGRSKKQEEAQSVQDEAKVEEYGEPLPPLTAAAFWAAPEPEPEPEPAPEIAPDSEKKKRGGRKAKPKVKADDSGTGKPKSRSRAKSKSETKPDSGEKDGGEETPHPLPMDRADEADTPMHWLDEI